MTAQSMISRAELEADQRRQDLTFAELVHQVERRMLHLVIINAVTMVGVLVGLGGGAGGDSGEPVVGGAGTGVPRGGIP